MPVRWWILICICTVVWPASGFADLDLCRNARLRVSGTQGQSDVPIDPNPGRAALRDGDASRAWAPETDEPAWIELDLSPDGADTALTLDRVEIDWSENWAESVTLYGGPDPYTLTRLANVTVTDPERSVVSFDTETEESPDDIRYLILRFPKGDFAVSRLSVHAARAPALSGVPSLQLSGEAGILSLKWTSVAKAHHYEIERGGDENTVFESVRARALDRPPVSGDWSYRVRAVDYLGRPGDWSNAVAVTDYDPQTPETVRFRGVVEGFYGKPWSHPTRLRVLRWMGIWGMNRYLYAPKKEEKHRTKWRELYTEEELAPFAELLSHGRDYGVETIYGISPGQDIDPLSDNDFQVLTAKLSQLLDRGYREFSLLMDDIDVEPGAASGANHAVLTARLFAWLRDRTPDGALILVPTVYSGTPGRLDEDKIAYLEALKDLDPAIAIAWTGQGTFDEEITAEEAADFATLIGRKPLIWDNYPVNDFDLGLGLYLAPVAGRDASLLEETEGILANPMIEGTASLFAVESYASLLSDPDNYDADTHGVGGVAPALDPEFPEADWAALQSFFLTNSKLFPEREPSPDLAAIIEDFLTAYALGGEEMISGLAKTLFERLQDIRELVQRIRDRSSAVPLTDELELRLAKLAAQAEGGQIALNLLQADLYGTRGQFGKWEQRLETLRDGPLNVPFQAADLVLGELIARAEVPADERAEARFLENTRLSPILADPLPSARSGQAWYFDAGFRMPTDLSWSVDADACLNATVNERGLVRLLPDARGEDCGGLSIHRAWVRLTISDNSAVERLAFFVDVLPALADDIDGLPPLPLTTERILVDEVPVLLQNGVVPPDYAFSQYARSNELAGVWKKRRMELDHRLTFGDRSEAVLERMAAEASGALDPDFDDSDWEDIELPAAENRLCPLGDESGPEEYWSGVWYRREVVTPGAAKNARLVMLGASYVIDAWADGVYLGHHEGGDTPFVLPWPESLADRDRATLVFRVDRPLPGIVPGMLPGRTDTKRRLYAGIYGNFHWEYLEPEKRAVLARVDLRPLHMNGRIRAGLVVENTAKEDLSLVVYVEAFETKSDAAAYWSGASVSGSLSGEVSLSGKWSSEINPKSGERAAVQLDFSLKDAREWSPEAPRLYAMRVTLRDRDDNQLDRYLTTFAFRKDEIDEDGGFKHNGQDVFYPGITYVEDSALTGPGTSWSRIRMDLARIRNQGAQMTRTAFHPPHPEFLAAADRMGALVQVDLPAWRLSREELAVQENRPLLLQMWHETLFASTNRGSVLFWNPCTECEAGPELNRLFETLKTDLPEIGTAPQYLAYSISAGGEDARSGENAPEDMDLLAVSTHFGVDYGTDIMNATLDSFAALQRAFPATPILVSEFGGPSERYEELGVLQLDVLDGAWNAIQAYAREDSSGKVNAEGFLIGANWHTLTDGYGQDGGVDLSGLYRFDRYTPKPSADRLREFYSGYWPTALDEVYMPVRYNVDNSGSMCRSAYPDPGSAAWAALALFVWLRAIRRRRANRRPER